MTAGVAYVPNIRVSHDQQSEYDAIASRLLRKAVAEYSSIHGLVDTEEWHLVHKKRKMRLYRSLRGTDDPRVTLMVGTGLISGSLEDVMDGLYADNTEDFRAMKTFSTKKFIDGAVLNVSEKRVPEAPFRFAGIRWSAARAAWGMVKHRDILTYERMGTTMDAHGNELAFHVLQSIERPDWIVDAIKGIKRAQTATCYLYRRCNSRVQCFVWAEVYDIGSTSKWIAERVVAGALLSVVRSVECAEAKKYSKLMATAKTRTWSSINSCVVCCKSPGVFESLSACSGCLRDACKSCSHMHAIFELDPRSGKPVLERFCKLCTSKVLARPRLQDTAAMAIPDQVRQQQQDKQPTDVHPSDGVAFSFAKSLQTITKRAATHPQSDTALDEQLETRPVKFIDLADMHAYLVSSDDDDDDDEGLSDSDDSEFGGSGPEPADSWRQ